MSNEFQSEFRSKELIDSVSQLREGLGMSIEHFYQELNQFYLHGDDRVSITTVFRWFAGQAPKGEATLAILQWIKDKTENKTK